MLEKTKGESTWFFSHQKKKIIKKIFLKIDCFDVLKSIK
jgi:hypothetical protein